MRLGLLTYHRAYNCGAMLQAWALQTALERMGHQVELPSCNSVGETSRWQYAWTNPEKHGLGWIRSLVGRSMINCLSIPSEDILIHRYRKFRKTFIRECDCVPTSFDNRYDAVVVGSDQVWSDRHSENDAPLFFGENLSPNLRKIAYAASYGDKPLEGERLKRLVSAANRFDAISVRENLAKNQLAQYVKKDIAVVLDPTLLLKCEDYECFQSSPPCNEPYLFMYTISKAPYMFQTARELARRLGVRCIVAPCYQYGRYHAEKGIVYSISPERLVAYSRQASYIVTGSFHGTVMGLLFNKPTISLRDHVDQYESRPTFLLNSVGCGDRLANPTTSIDKMLEMLSHGFAPSAYDKISSLRNYSLSWLKEKTC